ncbi:hypothetical protein SERLADRAFT_404865 [Serpula lacrymans var. lacrymans S7.9]|uniref:Uncharacterized protein n=1 Tax=Serpula lacrymans var. lacrymans (strain S7.9) TaxID=578457 RepID=F8NFQ3_SERL9|nr:uncharacterized protein SERLADRAFT_404865 [Serpula lacrymans var. lacrymans S7.9]EGO30893.1 hypothetical protein SERLADRAFT_404865 [Serpula lacrymans var. lacrymans S7.9]
MLSPNNLARRQTGSEPASRSRATKVTNVIKQVLQDKNTELEQELARLKGELSKANKAQINAENARLDAEKSAEEARSRMLENKHRNSPVDEVPYTILKPRASELYTGKDRLRRAMGLTENKKKYLCIQARCYHPYLAHFQNDWATSELIKQYLSNWGKNESRKERKMVASTSPPDTNYLKYEGEQEQEQEQPQDGENTRNIDKNWD